MKDISECGFCSSMFIRNEQRTLLQQFEGRSRKLAGIYAGGLRVLADEENPTRFQLAAHALREVIANCAELIGVSAEHGDGMKQRLAPVRKAFFAVSKVPESNEDGGVPLTLMRALQEYFEWEQANRPQARKKAALVLSQLSGAGPGLPSDVVENDLSAWMEADDFFKLVAHHKRTCDRDMFVSRLFMVEDVLIRRMQPRPVSDLDEIDSLIQESEDDK